MNGKAPGSYTERANSLQVSSGVATTSTAGFVGVTIRGSVTEAIKVTSWKEFCDNFAYGYPTPFSKGNLAYGVFGFFKNGGSELYISRVIGTGAKEASAEISEITYTAKEVGAWGNDINVDMKETLSSGVFVLTITIDGEKVEEIKGLTEANFVTRINSESRFVNVKGSTLVAGNGALESGVDGTISATEYTNALKRFDVCPDIRLCAIPDETGTGIQEALEAYCDLDGEKYPIFDCPPNLTPQQAIDFKKKLTSFRGAFYYPRICINDPLTGEVIPKGHAGHITGVYTRFKVHEAPAGLMATINGAVNVERKLTSTEVGLLNDNNVNCIVPKTGHGIVVWGAKLLNPDGDREYVSDLRTDMFIEQTVKQKTEIFVFQPKDDSLFTRVNATLKTFLKDCWDEGMLLGTKPEEAFFTKCDRELNPDTNSTTLEAEIGYARKKPAEYIITKISHKQAY